MNMETQHGMMDDNRSKLPLAGIRVADFTWIGAGSYTTKLLADFGADIIKIETSTHLDTLRETAPFRDGMAGVNRSGYFADRNASKRSMTLNLKHPKAAALARRLIAKCDIVANNFTPGTMDRLGLGYNDIKAIKRDIIYLSMSMQGGTGPHAGYVGFGLTIGALAGLHHLSGPVERPPAGTATNYPDHVPNPCHAAFALLAALFHRRKTGEGQYIDFAQTEPTIDLLSTAVIDYTVNGRVAERNGNRQPDAIVHGVYRCKGEDRWIAISAYEDAQWQALVAVLQLPPSLRDWCDAGTREQYADELDALLGTYTVRHDARELMTTLQAHGVAAGMVQNARDLVEDDPQLKHRAHWVTLQHPEMGACLYNSPPAQLGETPAHLSRPAPLLGQHTREICCDLLELDDVEYAQFDREGVFE